MEFIREKTKEKPMSRKKLWTKIGFAALCGLVFAITVVVVILICMPMLQDRLIPQTEDSEKETLSQVDTEETEDTESEAEILIPPNFSLSISDYQTLQDELYRIGNMVNKSIVTVMTMSGENDVWAENPFETEGQSSGIIVAEDDNYLYVLTEKKVILDADAMRVSFIDNAGAEAKLLKYDGNTGLAVLTVEKRLLTRNTKVEIAVASLGSSYEISNGAIVIALGSPLGTNYSILTGNITSIQNEIATKDKNYSVFTTDIVASEHASGVLANTKGEIIGIVMQSFSGSQDMNTLTVVGVDELKDMITVLCNGKDLPYMGVYISTVTEDISRDYDIPVGVYIKDIVSDSPAMRAGLQSGDVIVSINGEAIATDVAFSNKISQFIPDTTCEVTVKRQNGNEYYDVTCMVEIGVLK